MGKEKKKRFKQKFRVDPVGLSAADELPNEEKIFGTVSRVVDMVSFANDSSCNRMAVHSQLGKLGLYAFFLTGLVTVCVCVCVC